MRRSPYAACEGRVKAEGRGALRIAGPRSRDGDLARNLIAVRVLCTFKVVARLEVHPERGRRLEIAPEAKRRLGRDRPVPADDLAFPVALERFETTAGTFAVCARRRGVENREFPESDPFERLKLGDTLAAA
jgi:hypothetical protein